MLTVNFCVRNVNLSTSLHCTKYNLDKISLLTSADFYLFHKLLPIPKLRTGKNRNQKKERSTTHLATPLPLPGAEAPLPSKWHFLGLFTGNWPFHWKYSILRGYFYTYRIDKQYINPYI